MAVLSQLLVAAGYNVERIVIQPGDAVVDLVEVLLVVTAVCQAGYAAAHAIVARFKASRPQASIYVDTGPD
jgi:hypothetical protein